MSATGSRRQITMAGGRRMSLVTSPIQEWAAEPPGQDRAASPESAARRQAARAPLLIIAALALGHVVIWTLVPSLVHLGLPIDTLEGYVVGRHWLIGDHKHPSLPWWLVEASRIVTGTVGWPAYLISGLCIAATYGLVFAVGRRLLDTERAVAGVLPLSGILYFSWVTPEFNHNVLQMPLWVAIILCTLRVRSTGDATAWMWLGAISAIGLYAKLSTAILLATVAMFLLADRACRRQLATPGPWLGLAVFALIVFPIAQWLLRTEFAAFDYASYRATGSSSSVALFLLKQVAASAGFYALVVFAASGRGWRQRIDWPRWRQRDWSALEIIAFFHFAPLILAVIAAHLSGSGLKGSWATPMLSLSGMLVVALAPRLVDARAIRRLAMGAAACLTLIPATYAVSITHWDLLSQRPPRVAWPQREVAQRLESIWREKTGKPLRHVIGDVWHAGMVATYGAERAVTIVDGLLAYVASVTVSDLERDGALLVYGPGAAYPPHELRWLVGERVDGLEQIAIRGSERGVDGLVWYTIIAPGSVIGGPSQTRHPAARQRTPVRKRERSSP